MAKRPGFLESLGRSEEEKQQLVVDEEIRAVFHKVIRKWDKGYTEGQIDAVYDHLAGRAEELAQVLTKAGKPATVEQVTKAIESTADALDRLREKGELQ